MNIVENIEKAQKDFHSPWYLATTIQILDIVKDHGKETLAARGLVVVFFLTIYERALLTMLSMTKIVKNFQLIGQYTVQIALISIAILLL